MDDGGSQQDPDALQQISHHVDESRLHAGVGVSMCVAVILTLCLPLQPAGVKPVAVVVRGTRLMQDQDHAKQNKAIKYIF